VTVKNEVMADEYLALLHRNKYNFDVFSNWHYFKFLYYSLFCIFDQINAGFMSLRDFFKKH